MSEPAQIPHAGLDAIDRAAVRRCALICWQRREQLALSPDDIEQNLIAFMAIGEPVEGERASAVLQAIRDLKAKQLQFDAILPRSAP